MSGVRRVALGYWTASLPTRSSYVADSSTSLSLKQRSGEHPAHAPHDAARITKDE